MKKVILVTLALAPMFAFAQSTGRFGNIKTLVEGIGDIIKIALPIVVALAFLLSFGDWLNLSSLKVMKKPKQMPRRLCFGV